MLRRVPVPLVLAACALSHDPYLIDPRFEPPPDGRAEGVDGRVDGSVEGAAGRVDGVDGRVEPPRRDLLDQVSEALLERETLDGAELQLLIRGEPLPPLPSPIAPKQPPTKGSPLQALNPCVCSKPRLASNQPRPLPAERPPLVRMLL